MAIKKIEFLGFKDHMTGEFKPLPPESEVKRLMNLMFNPVNNNEIRKNEYLVLDTELKKAE